MSDRFTQERWSLHVTLDPEHAYGPHDEILESIEFRRFLLRDFGGLPEEFDEVVRIYADTTRPGEPVYRWEVTSPIIDWLCRVIDWVTGHCIPVEVRLVRNDERNT